MRLIDADALVKIKFHGYPEIEIVPSGVNAEAYKRGWNDAIDAIIECEPSIDAVKHGRWKYISFLTVECSECKAQIHDLEYSNFCPNCGADMRGEQNG